MNPWNSIDQGMIEVGGGLTVEEYCQKGELRENWRRKGQMTGLKRKNTLVADGRKVGMAGGKRRWEDCGSGWMFVWLDGRGAAPHLNGCGAFESKGEDKEAQWNERKIDGVSELVKRRIDGVREIGLVK